MVILGLSIIGGLIAGGGFSGPLSQLFLGVCGVCLFSMFVVIPIAGRRSRKKRAEERKRREEGERRILTEASRKSAESRQQMETTCLICKEPSAIEYVGRVPAGSYQQWKADSLGHDFHGHWLWGRSRLYKYEKFLDSYKCSFCGSEWKVPGSSMIGEMVLASQQPTSSTSQQPNQDFAWLRELVEKGGVQVSTVKCPNCAGKIDLPTEGNLVKCAYCGHTLFVEDVYKIIKQVGSNLGTQPTSPWIWLIGSKEEALHWHSYKREDGTLTNAEPRPYAGLWVKGNLVIAIASITADTITIEPLAGVSIGTSAPTFKRLVNHLHEKELRDKELVPEGKGIRFEVEETGGSLSKLVILSYSGNYIEGKPYCEQDSAEADLILSDADWELSRALDKS